MPLSLIKRHRLPISIVRLDTQEAREAAMNGKYFQITDVPTMIVIYTDGNSQTLKGGQDISQYINGLVSQRRGPASRRVSEEEEPIPPDGVNMYDGVYTKPSHHEIRPIPPGGRRQIIVDDYDDHDDQEPTLAGSHPSQRKNPALRRPHQEEIRSEPEPEDYIPEPIPAQMKSIRGRRAYPQEDEYVEYNDETLVPPPIKRRGRPRLPPVDEDEIDEGEDVDELLKSLPKPRKLKAGTKAAPKPKKAPKKKGRKGKIVDEVEIEYIDQTSEVPSTKPQSVPKKSSSRMQDLINSAKQMELDMKNSLGYKEEDLPRYGPTS